MWAKWAVQSGMATTLANLLADKEELTCPVCTRPLVVSKLPDGKSRFDACGRNCLSVYQVPDDCILLGPEGGLMIVYRRKWTSDYPPATIVPKYVGGGW